MKKFIIVLLVSILLMGIITGCADKKNNEVSESDTVKWINTTHAILTKVNRNDINLFGGMSPNSVYTDSIKVVLEEWWGVIDRTSADETIESLIEEGHRTEYAEEMAFLKEDGLFDVSREEAREYLEALGFEIGEIESYIASMDAYETYGITAIDAWDYTRALNLLGWYYIAGYYTQEEALDKSLEVAKELQTLYNSWEDVVESYFLGFTYWVGEDPNDSSSQLFERRKIYEELKASSNNPYQLDWNIDLKKVW